MIKQKNISLLSNRLLKEHSGRRIPEFVLERDYCIAWFLVGYSKTALPEMLAFKGGTVLKRCYFDDYRFSEDLDFTLLDGTEPDTLLTEFETAFGITHAMSGISFKIAKVENSTNRTFRCYFSYDGPLPRTSNTIKVDITLSEKLTFQLEDRFVLTSYIEFDDLPEDASIKAYSLKEIATEKVVAILDRRRSEPRDIYDFWYLTRSQYVDCLDLVPAIEEKLTFRGLKLVDEAKNFDSGKEAKYRKAWKQRLEQQMSQLPEFESVNRAVQREFRRVHILGN